MARPLIKFGKEAKEHFYLDSDIFFTNHGSYGSVPKSILEKKRDLQIQIDTAPDRWFRYDAFDHWNKNIRSLTSYLHINEANLVFCENATDAINSIFKSISFENENNDAILAMDVTYNAVLKTIDYTSTYRLPENKHVQVFKVPVRFPIESKQSVLDDFDKMCSFIVNEKKLRLRVAIVDHISSATATLYPVQEINQIIRKWSSDAIIVIDGAHAIGQIDIKLNELDCDFYVSNLHKWFLAARGCAFLYFRDAKLADSLQPSYISHGYNKSVSANFSQRGTRDLTSWFLVDECIQFYEYNLGGLSTITTYCEELLALAVPLLVDGWKTSALAIPKDMEAPFMKLIKLPEMKSFVVSKEVDNREEVSVQLMKAILDDYKIIACVMFIGSDLYIRISSFVYNDLKDYIALKNAILDLQSK